MAETAAGTPRPQLPAALSSMLEALSPAAQRELRRVLHLTLFPPADLAEEREGELGPLARLLRERGEWPPETAESAQEMMKNDRTALSPRRRWPTIARDIYDRWRPEGALSGRALMRRHRTDDWVLICLLASALPLDGQPLVNAQSWAHGIRGVAGSTAAYTPDECLDAIADVAEAFGRRVADLTSTLYSSWTRAQRRRARTLGQPDPRLPSERALTNHFGGWSAALAAAVDRQGTPTTGVLAGGEAAQSPDRLRRRTGGGNHDPSRIAVSG